MDKVVSCGKQLIAEESPLLCQMSRAECDLTHTFCSCRWLVPNACDSHLGGEDGCCFSEQLVFAVVFLSGAPKAHQHHLGSQSEFEESRYLGDFCLFPFIVVVFQ